MLQRLVTHPDSRQHEHRVLCLGSPTTLGTTLSEAGVQVEYLNVHPRNPISLLRLFLINSRVVRFEPDVVHTWMYHANMLAALCIWRKAPVLWAIHHDLTDTHAIKKLTALVIRMGAWFSKAYPKKIVSVSQVGVESHIPAGYEPSKFIVIPNGFAIPPLNNEKASVAQELGIASTAQLIGMVARYHPMKDHANLIDAAALLSDDFPNVRFVLAGKEIDWSNPELVSRIEFHGLRDRFHLLGERSDINRLLSSLAIYTLSSRSEGFPLTIGEAMAMAVPSVATNVGDVAELIADTGLLVPSGNPQALAEAWGKLLSIQSSERLAMGQAARERIRQHFSLEAMVARYNSVYEEIAQED
ncbi:MAG: glycosyltransferase [Anaerolineales bacterium]|nr:glycosyltransferase [Anaerolineales bacterium]